MDHGENEKAITLHEAAAVELGPTTELRFSLRELRGEPLIDIRLFHRNDFSGQYLATKRGFSFRVDSWADFVSGTAELDGELRKISGRGTKDNGEPDGPQGNQAA